MYYSTIPHMHLCTIAFRDMQLLTMEEANVYEKKEKGQKSLRALQNQVCVATIQQI